MAFSIQKQWAWGAVCIHKELAKAFLQVHRVKKAEHIYQLAITMMQVRVYRVCVGECVRVCAPRTHAHRRNPQKSTCGYPDSKLPDSVYMCVCVRVLKRQKSIKTQRVR